MIAPKTTRMCGVVGWLLACAAGAGAQVQVEAPNEPTHHLEDDPAPGSMDDAERDRRARDKFNQGREAYEQGEYRDAWDYFRQAYVLSRRPALLYNVGQSADRLGLDEEALKAFRLYLRDAPDAENRREVENRVRALEKRVAEQGGNNPGPTVDTTVDTATAGEGDPDAANASAGANADDDLELPEAPSEGQPKRDGWYYMGRLGLSLFADKASGTGGLEHTISGAGVALDLAAGWPVTPSIVLGGTLLMSFHNKPSREDDVQLDHANLVLVGPFIDYFPAPLTGPWHFQAALAVGSLGMARSLADDTIGTKDAVAGAIMVGGTHEWQLGKALGGGVGARMILGSASEGDAVTHNIFSLALTGTATWY